jgi:hypothetical protein
VYTEIKHYCSLLFSFIITWQTGNIFYFEIKYATFSSVSNWYCPLKVNLNMSEILTFEW